MSRTEAEAQSELVRASDSGWREFWLKEDWWAIWLGLGIVVIAYVAFANGSSIRWIAVTPARWSSLAQLARRRLPRRVLHQGRHRSAGRDTPVHAHHLGGPDRDPAGLDRLDRDLPGDLRRSDPPQARSAFRRDLGRGRRGLRRLGRD